MRSSLDVPAAYSREAQFDPYSAYTPQYPTFEEEMLLKERQERKNIRNRYKMPAKRYSTLDPNADDEIFDSDSDLINRILDEENQLL